MNMPEAWQSLGQADVNNIDLAMRVGAVFRARELLSGAVANLPFAILNKSGDEVDTSQDYKNAIGFLPNPVDLFRRWRLSMFMTNRAYGFATKKPLTAKGGKLLYITPWSIQDKADPSSGALSFIRKTSVGQDTYTEYKESGDKGRIVHIWKLDETTELLPSEYTEFAALSNAAGIMHYTDSWTSNYFKRGGVKPTLISVKGVTTPTAKDELQTGFTKWIKNVSREIAKVINGDAMDVKQIGDGIAELKDMPVYTQAMQSVCAVAGIPVSLFMSDFANFATAQTYYWQFYKDKVIPDAQAIQDQLNEQVFIPLGYKFEFRPEASEPNQTEETERANALSTFMDFMTKAPTADLAKQSAIMYGYELDDDMQAAIDDYFANKQEPPASQSVQPDPQTTTQMPMDNPSPDGQTTSGAQKFVPNMDQVRELNLWQTMAFRKHKKGMPLSFPFELRVTPEAVGDAIREKLTSAATEDDIKAAFDLSSETVTPAPDYTPLLKSIELGVEALRLMQKGSNADTSKDAQ